MQDVEKLCLTVAGARLQKRQLGRQGMPDGGSLAGVQPVSEFGG